MTQYPADHDGIVSEYEDEIFEYIREIQDEMLPDPNYMAIKQKDTLLSWEMRSKLILWLVEVHRKYLLRQEVLFLTINYLDRFLSLKEVSASRLQLVGTVALSIAIKYEASGELVTMKGLQKLCNGTYKAEHFRTAEIFMLDKLQYKLGWPGPLIFVTRISAEIDDAEPTTRTLAKYFLEAILPHKSFVAKRPSITAAAAYCLARCMLGMGEWTPLHVRISEYNYPQLHPLMITILKWLNQPEEFLVVFNKYCLWKNLRMARFVKKKLESGFVIEDQCLAANAYEAKNSLDTDSSSKPGSSLDAVSISDRDSSSDDEIYFSA